MEDIFTIIGQDLEVAENLVVREDFSSVQMIGNRIMTNLFAADKSELMILGWIVKELGLEFTSLQTKKNDKLNEAKEHFKDFLKRSRYEIQRGNSNSKTYWEAYNTIEAKIRVIELPDHERTVYNDQVGFSKNFAIKMIDVFYSNKDMLFLKHNNLIPVITNELSRNYNQHGGEETLAAYFVFRAFDNYYRYAFVEMFVIREAEIFTRTKAKLNDYIKCIYNLKQALVDQNLGNLYNVLDEILIRLGIDYRLYYLKYADIAFPVVIPSIKNKTNEEELELSTETMRKIVLCRIIVYN